MQALARLWHQAGHLHAITNDYSYLLSIMYLGLDYDFTYTEDPIFWNKVIELATERMHTVVCVTGRDAPPSEDEPQLPACVEIVCAGDQFKRHAAAEAGYTINVWIDDCPGTIEPQRKLEW